MTEKEMLTLEKYLSARLGAPSDEGFSFGALFDDLQDIAQNRPAFHAARLEAARMDFVDAVRHDENFSIRPLPKSSYSQSQIVGYVREFYEAKGFQYDEQRSDLSWWATLYFQRDSHDLVQATLSIYPMNGMDPDNDELLVTTEKVR